MASRTDYKFTHISRRDDDPMFVKTYFSEGEITTEDEEGISITRYRRSGRVKRPLTDFKSPDISLKRLVDDDNAVELIWSRHLTDAQLRTEMDIILAEDGTRTAIDEQTR